jgi:nitroreductase
MAQPDARTVLNLIKARRTVRTFDPRRRIGDRSLKRVLEAGTWAPYAPYYPQGWKFIALRGEQRDHVAAILTGTRTILKYIRAAYEASLHESTRISDEEQRWKEAAKGLARNLGDAPVIVVGLVPSDRSIAIRTHNLGSAWAAVQNMMLQAHAEGFASGVLTAQSRTVERRLLEYLQFNPNEWIVAFALNLGYPLEVPEPAARQTGVVEIRG